MPNSPFAIKFYDLPEEVKECAVGPDGMKNAIVTDTTLGTKAGYQESLFSCAIGFDYGYSGQSLCGYALDGKVEGQPMSERLPTEYGMAWIMGILKAAGADCWESLRGKHVRVISTGTQVLAIGHFNKDIWFCPESIGNHYFPESNAALSKASNQRGERESTSKRPKRSTARGKRTSHWRTRSTLSSIWFWLVKPPLLNQMILHGKG